MPSKPYWKNSKFWVCPRHLPSVNIPGHIEKCWYAGCISTRPVKEVDPFADFDATTLKKMSKTTKKKRTPPVKPRKATVSKKKTPTPATTAKSSSPENTKKSKTTAKTKVKVKATEQVLSLCAWFKCDKDNGAPAKARKQSKYCSRDCSNRNARWRMKQRQKETK